MLKFGEFSSAWSVFESEDFHCYGVWWHESLVSWWIESGEGKEVGGTKG